NLLILLSLFMSVAVVRAQHIAAGNGSSLTICSDSTVRSTGYNNYGQLGDSSNTNRGTPVQVKGINNIVAVSSGNSHSLFLKDDGTVYACGWNINGQLGDSTNTSRNVPVIVKNVSNIKAIDAGLFYSLFLKTDSTV